MPLVKSFQIYVCMNTHAIGCRLHIIKFPEYFLRVSSSSKVVCAIIYSVADYSKYFHKSMSTVWNLNFIQVVLLCSQFHFELNHWKWWKMMEKRFLSDKERFVLSWRHLKNFPFNLPHFSKFCKWFSNGFPFIEFNDTECIFWKTFLKDLIRLKLTGNLQQ